MKHYLSTKQIAQLWHISQRRVAQYCSEGRIPGTKKIGSSWLIPDDAAKPIDPRLKKEKKGNVDHLRVDLLCLMPLMYSSFKPGEALLTVENMTSKPKRDIALAEYYYFTSQAEKHPRSRKATLSQTRQQFACRLY